MKKIMFNDRYGLTEAVLSGRKTQTRRVVSERLLDKWTDYDDFCNSVGVGDIPTTREYYDERKFFLDNSPYKVGEVVAVAQSYADAGFGDTTPIIGIYENDMPIFASEAGVYNKMFVRADLMPHQIRITNVRVERLRSITDADCLAEGVIEACVSNNWGNSASHWEYNVPYEDSHGQTKLLRGLTPQEAYAALIDRISGKGTWDSNPWVFVYDFELIK